MSKSVALALPPKDLSFALKNTPETVTQRKIGIQSYLDDAFLMVARTRLPSFAAALQAFVRRRTVPQLTKLDVDSGWDATGEWRYQLPVSFFDSEYMVCWPALFLWPSYAQNSIDLGTASPCASTGHGC